MQEQFVTYEIALSLKELGFNEPCLACYTFPIKSELPILTGHYTNEFKKYYNFKLKEKNITVPLWQQCLDWFREKHDIHIVITVNPYSEIKEVNGYKIYTNINSTLVCVSNQELQTWSYYMAREQAILKVIDIIKKEQNEKLD